MSLRIRHEAQACDLLARRVGLATAADRVVVQVEDAEADSHEASASLSLGTSRLAIVLIDGDAGTSHVVCDDARAKGFVTDGLARGPVDVDDRGSRGRRAVGNDTRDVSRGNVGWTRVLILPLEPIARRCRNLAYGIGAQGQNRLV